MKTIWAIGGSDSSGGAGVAADQRTMEAFGHHTATVVTAVTAQGMSLALGYENVSTEILFSQIKALQNELAPSAIKIGMLGSESAAQIVGDLLSTMSVPVVCDPVLSTSSGVELLDSGGRDLLVRHFFPKSVLVTPNLLEARSLSSLEDIEEAGEWFIEQGAKAVLIKGGHGEGKFVQDFFFDGSRRSWLTHLREDFRRVRGTGCALASAVAVGLAEGLELLDAVVRASAYVYRGIRRSQVVVDEVRTLFHASWPGEAADLPWLTPTAEEGRVRPAFPAADPLGFYPIVDRADWVDRLSNVGAKTIQLRVKDLSDEALENEIVRAVHISKERGISLYINDYWELAIRHHAYGVHLGQEDLETADIASISRAGLRLGISTHCYSELARAKALNPSYIALGPIFPTKIKSMRFAPQSLEGLRLWRRLVDRPLVAIGGITLERSHDVWAAGADGVAVITDVLSAKSPEERAQDWMQTA